MLVVPGVVTDRILCHVWWSLVKCCVWGDGDWYNFVSGVMVFDGMLRQVEWRLIELFVGCDGDWCNFVSGVVVIDDQPEVTIDDPAFLFENNDGFQEVTSKKALKIKLKQEAELLKKTEQQQQKKRDNSNKVGTGNKQWLLE